MRLAIDYSSFAWTSLLGGKDEENGYETIFNEKKVWINSAIYGYDRLINMLVARMNHWNVTPQDVILVVEGKGSKLPRQIIANYYKGGSEKAPGSYEQFIQLREHMIEVWRNIGGTIIIQDNAEADDVIAWLARETEEELVICSNDNDLSVLYTEKNDHGVEVHCHIGDLVDVNKYAVESDVLFDHKFITTYKALVGDPSDNIPGIHRFGPKSFGKLVREFGLDGLEELQEMLEKGSLDEIADQAESNKTIKLLCENEQAVVTSYKLAKTYPNWVNTMKDPMQILAGMVKPKEDSGENATDPRLAKWAGQKVLVTEGNFDAMFRHLQAHLPLTKRTPAFDIETSTPPESDEWLAAQGKGADAVDTLGSKLTGFSITYGDNHQYTVYVSVKHRDTANVTMVQARRMIELLRKSVIHNLNFELPVLYLAQDEDGTYWRDHWKDNGYHGFMPNALDTKLQCSYVNENIKLGLKLRSKVHLGYEQATFEQTTQFTGEKGTLPAGGRLIREFDDIVGAEVDPEAPLVEGAQPPTKIVVMQTRQYKMNELPAEHVFDYGCDDTICTAALHVYTQLVMQLEHTWDIYRSVELYAAYQHAKNFVDGMPFSLQRCRELDKEDTEDFNKAWATVRAYLIEKGWAGTVPPTFTPEITAQEIKYAYRIVKDLVEGGFKMSVTEAGDDEDAPADEAEDDEVEEESSDPFLSTRTRKPSKMADLAESLGEGTFAAALRECLESPEGAEKFTRWVNSHFKGEPVFKFSSKQMCHLMYEVMGLPVVVRGKVSATMRAKGQKVGNPAANELAIKYAIRDGDPNVKGVLEGLRVMKMVVTRKGLFYSKYPGFAHWMTGRIHGSHNQCHTNTRRASESKPNKQQLSKHVKVEGYTPKVREMIVPHHPKAVIVSLDFDSQELRVIADYSKDPNMVACYVGDNKKGMHSLTGLGILHRQHKIHAAITYDEFEAINKDKTHALNKLIAECRALGKKTNFTTEYGAMAPKLAATLMVTEEEAQAFIDAREAAFPVASAWKQSVIAEAKKKGYVTTMCGARRHLRDALRDPDGWIKLKAERQAVNFKIQSSSAEMTKLAEGRVWEAGLTYKYDAICIGPVHDEIVFSVMLDDLEAFLVDAHRCMVAPYGGMTIPIESSISFGPNFGQQIEIGIAPTAEAIQRGKEKLLALTAN